MLSGIYKSSSGDDSDPSVLALDDWFHLLDVALNDFHILHVTWPVVCALGKGDKAIATLTDKTRNDESVVASQVQFFVTRDFALTAEDVDRDYLGMFQVGDVEDDFHSRKLEEVVVAIPGRDFLKGR